MSTFSFFSSPAATPAPESKDLTVTTELVEEDALPEQAVSVPDGGDTGEGGKLKMIIQLVKKCLGVKDIATM